MSTDTHPSSCPLCGSRRARRLYDLRDVACPPNVPGVVVRCRACAMVYKQLVDPGDVARAYGEAYGAASLVKERYMLSKASRRFFRDVLAGFSPVPTDPAATPPRLLDIGTGLGALLEEAAAFGFDAEGIELCAPLAARARERGLAVRTQSAESLAEDEGQRYDAITLMDVIEHVPDPLALLATVRQLLAPGGKVAVYTPNHRAAVVLAARALRAVGVGGPVRDIFGGNHVCFFDHRSLADALTRAGFALQGERRFPYDPARPGQPMSRAQLLATTAVDRLGQPFGRVFRLVAYAVPKAP